MEWSIENAFENNKLLKKNVKKDTDERALEIKNMNFECRVKNINVQLTKWRCVKNKMEKLNLNDNDFNKLTNKQLSANCF